MEEERRLERGKRTEEEKIEEKEKDGRDGYKKKEYEERERSYFLYVWVYSINTFLEEL